jgi:hypothetical protein
MATIRIDRKQRFLINSLILGALMYAFSFKVIETNPITLLIATAYLLFSIFIVHYPNITLKNLAVSSILPLFLSYGAFLVLRYFPNLALSFRLTTIIGYAALYYVVSLVDNIFLVVNDRKEIIPLYRVAVTWSHIMIIVIAIPFYTGIFKLPINSLFQNIIIFFATLIFCLYIIWASRHDKGMKNVSVGEGTLLSIYSSFIVSGMSTAVSFFPTEAFMRALLVSSTLMFVMNYSITGYLKNEIYKKIIFEYLGIVLLFFFLTLVFD